MAYGESNKETTEKATRNRESNMPVAGRKVALKLVTGKTKRITCSGDTALKDEKKRKESMSKEKEEMRRFIKKTYPMVEVTTYWSAEDNVFKVMLKDGSKLYDDPTARPEKVEAPAPVMPEVTA